MGRGQSAQRGLRSLITRLYSRNTNRFNITNRSGQTLRVTSARPGSGVFEVSTLDGKPLGRFSPEALTMGGYKPSSRD